MKQSIIYTNILNKEINQKHFLRKKYIGALTSKPYAFNFRKWKLQTLETIDLFDSFGSNIRVDIEGSHIKRILPSLNNNINEEWITDKARFAYDGIKSWEFVQPSLRVNYSKFFVRKSWKKIINFLSKNFFFNNFNSFIIKSGNFTDIENIVMLKDFANFRGNCYVNNINVPFDLRKNYLFNLNLDKIVGNKVIIIVGSNLRFENPILNLKIKKLSLKNNILLSYIGSSFNSTYNMYHIGNSMKHLTKIISGKHLFCNIIKTFLKESFNNYFKNSISLIFGNSFLNRIDANEILKTLYINNYYYLKFDFNIIHLFSGNINALELGFSEYSKKNNNLNNSKNIYYLNETNTLNSNEIIKKNRDFVIFQGFINKKLLKFINVILPTPNIVEKYGLYANYNGVIQQSKLLFLPKQNKREHWKILSIMKEKIKLSHIVDNNIHITTRKQLYSRLKQVLPVLNKTEFNNKDLKINNILLKNFKNKIYNNSFKLSIDDYYLTDYISSNSSLMQQCSKKFSSKNNYV